MMGFLIITLVFVYAALIVFWAWAAWKIIAAYQERSNDRKTRSAPKLHSVP